MTKLREFNNQISLESDITGGNIKLFTNGSIQFTGAKSILAFVAIVSQVCSALSDVYDGQYCLEEAELQMLNMSLKANVLIPLSRLKGYVMQRGFVASYDPDSGFPGAKVSYVHGELKCTIMFFNSGHITFSSSQFMAIEEAYKFFVSILTEMNLQERSVIVQKTKALDGWTIDRGYSRTLTRLCCLDIE